MRTKGNNNLYLIMGDKGDGKTTLTTYLIETINRPTVIFDVAKQFAPNEYRIIVNGYEQLYYYLKNPHWLRAITKANLQLVVRFKRGTNRRKEIERCSEFLLDFPKMTLVFEEMDLYFMFQASTQNPIYEALYLSRNHVHEVICIFKQATMAHEVIKQNADYIITSNIESTNALNFFKDRGGKELVNKITSLEEREFLLIGKRKFRRVIKLKQSIVNKLK